MERSIALALFAPLLLSGCAGIRGITQTINVEALNNGLAVSGATCRLENDKGTWSITAPGSVEIAKSTRDLDVKCNMPGLQPAVATVHPGEVAPVGGFEKAMDALTESTRVSIPDYPETLRLEFGRTTEIGRK